MGKKLLFVYPSCACALQFSPFFCYEQQCVSDSEGAVFKRREGKEGEKKEYETQISEKNGFLKCNVNPLTALVSININAGRQFRRCVRNKRRR